MKLPAVHAASKKAAKMKAAHVPMSKLVRRCGFCFFPAFFYLFNISYLYLYIGRGGCKPSVSVGRGTGPPVRIVFTGYCLGRRM
jgi:hypothetical protein